MIWDRDKPCRLVVYKEERILQEYTFYAPSMSVAKKFLEDKLFFINPLMKVRKDISYKLFQGTKVIKQSIK